MERRLLVGLDFGGGGGRCLVLDAATGRSESHFEPWRLQTDPSRPLEACFDADATWQSLALAAREALSRMGGRPEEVVGLAASAVRHGTVLLDAAGREILAASNRDARGALQALELAAEHGAELHRDTGHWPHPIAAAARLRALADGELARASAHLSISDWLGYRLTGEIAAEPSQACASGLLDLASGDWSTDWIERLGLPRAIFPPLRAAGTSLGSLRPGAAEALGLPPGLPVGVGGGDTQCGLLGAGAVEAGCVAAIAGTSVPVQRVTPGPERDAEGRLWSVFHAVPGLWALESNCGGLGEGFDWLAGLLYADAPHPILQLLAEAARSQPGARGVSASAGGQVMDARRLGLPVGQITFTHLAAADDPQRRRHLARAAVEGMAYVLRANLEQIEAVTGRSDGPLRLGGGLSRSPLFGQILCEVLDRPVEVAGSPETTAYGAALCAGVAGGAFDGLAEGARACVRPSRSHEPAPEPRDRYAALYEQWCQLRSIRDQLESAAGPQLLAELQGSDAAGSAPATAPFRPRILVAADLDEAGLEALRALGEVEYQSYRKAMRLLTGPALVEALEGVHVFVTEVDVVDAPALLEARDLRAIAVCRGDAVNVDLEAASALGIPVVNTPGRNADAVADLTLAFVLMLARKLAPANAFLREPGGEAGDMGRMGRAFGALRGRELWHRTVGLVGLGAVGRKVVERLRPFGAHCLVYDPYLEADAVRLTGAEPVSLQRLLAESDFVSLHAAVSDSSRGLIDREALAHMKPGSALVNTARAALVDEEALLEALESGHLAGAALDVFAVEPPGSDHPLLAFENVIATPHVGGNTEQVSAHQGEIVAEELARIARGERPRHLLNPETWEGFRLATARPEPDPELRERLGKGPGPAVTDLQKSKSKPKRPAASSTAKAAGSDPAPAVEQRTENVEVQQKMKRILESFVERARSDEALGRFASSSQDVTLHFKLPDLGSELHLGFEGGSVIGAMGAPASAGIELKLSADLFDGMMTGRRNAMQAAMDGELSFSGDTAKAMTLTHIQADLSRIYGGVREELGDPGDLGSLAAPRAAAAAPARSPAAADDVRHQLVQVVNELYAAQLITSTGGNVSVRCSDDPSQAWITPSQLFKGDLSPEILVRIDMLGKAVEDGARSPSSEALMHTAVLKARPEATAVIHCHAPYATILANAELPFLPISTEAAFLVDIGRIPFVMPGTEELADAILEAMGSSWACLMQNHGLLVAGRTLRRAADMCEIVERTAEVIVGCYSVGKPPPVLPEKTVQMLAKYGDLMA